MAAVEARDLARLLRDWAHSVHGLAEALGVATVDAEAVIATFEEAGLVERADPRAPSVVGLDESSITPILWRTTIAGSALANARIGKPMSRSKAGGLLDGVVARAAVVNADAAMLHWVEELVLYGSFATEGDGPVGDVDLGVRMVCRYGQDDFFQR